MQSVKLKNNKYWDATGLYDSTLNKTQREVNAAQASATAAKYTKPSSGIPKTDLSSGVQSSLDKADTAIQQHQSLAAYRTAAAQDAIDAAQDAAIAGKYTKPGTGIPETDLASDAQSKIDNALPKTGDGSNVTAAFTAANNRTNISTGEKLSVLFGKIAKWFADLGSAAFRAATGSITQGSTDLVESGAVYNGLSGKYEKPASGIPASDLAAAVQSSLGRADSAVEYTAQTLTDAQKAQARSNIGAADVAIYQANRVDISNPNTNSSTISIVVTGDNAETTGQQSVHIGSGYLTENCALMIGTRGKMTDTDYITHPEYADYAENGYLESKLNSRGSVVIGTCQVNTPLTLYPSFAFGSKCIAGGGISIAIGQCCLATGILAVAIGDGLTAKYRSQHVICKYNNCLAEDYFEVGNGARGARSNAFRVTSTGHAIAQNALGIEDGNGGVVEISAAELQALKNLLT